MRYTCVKKIIEDFSIIIVLFGRSLLFFILVVLWNLIQQTNRIPSGNTSFIADLKSFMRNKGADPFSRQFVAFVGSTINNSSLPSCLSLEKFSSIQATVDSFPSNSQGCIVLSRRNYHVPKTVLIDNNRSLSFIGVAPEASIFTLAVVSNNSYLFEVRSGARVSFYNIGFEGQRASQKFATSAILYHGSAGNEVGGLIQNARFTNWRQNGAIEIGNYVDGLTVRDSTFENAYYSLYINNRTDIRHVIFENNRHLPGNGSQNIPYQININANTEDIHIVRNYIKTWSTPNAGAISISQTSNITINNNTLINTTDTAPSQAIHVESRGNNAHTIKIIDNIIKLDSTLGIEGISVIGGYHVTIHGNLIQGAQEGIALLGQNNPENFIDFVSIIGNHVWNAAGNGIRLIANSTANAPRRIVIQGNMIEGNGSNGIRITWGGVLGKPADIIVSENIIAKNGSDGIFVGRVNGAVIITDNILRNNRGSGIKIFNLDRAIVQGNISYDDQIPKTQTYFLSTSGKIANLLIMGNIAKISDHLTGSLNLTASVLHQYLFNNLMQD